MRPKLQEAVQHVHAQVLAECHLTRSYRLVMAALCNLVQTKCTLKKNCWEGISPKLQEAVQPVPAHHMAECAWRWTRRWVMAPFRNQTKCK